MEHIPILKRTGAVLLVIGLIDIGFMIYCLANQISYSSSFNIFAVIAGVFLLRGNLRAASATRWLSVFTLFGLVSSIALWPFTQPIALTLLQLRLNPGTAILNTVIFLVAIPLLYWLTQSLGAPSVLAARAAAGRPLRNMRIPAGLGLAMVLVVFVPLQFLLDGQAAAKAKQIAQQQLGSGYSYHVASIKIAKGTQGTSVRGIVTAWNANEIRTVPVSWQDN